MTLMGNYMFASPGFAIKTKQRKNRRGKKLFLKVVLARPKPDFCDSNDGGSGNSSNTRVCSNGVSSGSSSCNTSDGSNYISSGSSGKPCDICNDISSTCNAMGSNNAISSGSSSKTCDISNGISSTCNALGSSNDISSGSSGSKSSGGSISSFIVVNFTTGDGKWTLSEYAGMMEGSEIPADVKERFKYYDMLDGNEDNLTERSSIAIFFHMLDSNGKYN